MLYSFGKTSHAVPYGASSYLFFGDKMLSSEVGAQQGDPE